MAHAKDDRDQHDLLFCEETDAAVCSAHLMIRVNTGFLQPSTERFGINMEQFVALMERVCSHMLPFSSPYFMANPEEYQGYRKINPGKDQVFPGNFQYA